MSICAGALWRPGLASNDMYAKRQATLAAAAFCRRHRMQANATSRAEISFQTAEFCILFFGPASTCS